MLYIKLYRTKGSFLGLLDWKLAKPRYEPISNIKCAKVHFNTSTEEYYVELSFHRFEGNEKKYSTMQRFKDLSVLMSELGGKFPIDTKNISKK